MAGKNILSLATFALNQTSKMSTTTAVAKIPKPTMRRLHYSRVKRALFGAGISSTIGVLLWKTFSNDVKKQKYAEFYAQYDVEKEYKRMKEAGVFKSIPS